MVMFHICSNRADFQTLGTRVSRRTLDGAMVTLEQIEQTDSVLVENLHPGTTPDLLTLYFESKRGTNQKVKDVTMLSEGTAKVSFANRECKFLHCTTFNTPAAVAVAVSLINKLHFL